MTAAGTAGLTYGLCKALGVSQAGTSVGDQLQRSAVQAGVSTGFTIITQDQSVGEALLQGIVNVGASTAGGLGANTIGDLYVAGDIDALTHKALHALLGAALGAASNLDDPAKGAAGGAIGAAGAELVAENLPTSMEARTRADVGRAAGTVAAVVAGQDGNAAILAGSNAVQNNFDAPHYSEWEMEQAMEGFRLVAEAAGMKVPGLNEANEAVHSGVDIAFDFYDNVPFIEYAPPSMQIMRCMRAPAHMGVDFVLPSTAGEVALLVGGPLGKVPAAAKWVAVAAVKGGRKFISEILLFLGKAPVVKGAPVQVAKDPVSKTVSALDLAVKAPPPPPKRVTFQSSAEPSAALSVKPAGKPTPVADVAPKSILKPTSSTTKAPPSYERTSSHPASSSSSRSPQAPSTAPPASSSSSVHQRASEKTKFVSGVRVKKGEQPWVIRQGQEYKSKIIGRGQKTGTDGHSSASTRAAIKAAKRGDVEVVTLDRGVNRLLPEGSKVKPNTRPDTAYRTTDRKIHQLETPSKTDDPQKLMQRMEGTKESFPQEMRGETMLNYIKESLND